MTVSVWMRQPVFRAELSDIIRAAHPILVGIADNALLQLAAAGNTVAYEKVMTELRARRVELTVGPAGVGVDGTGAPAGIAAHIHIHGIPERQPFESLPPPRALPTPSAAATPAPAVR